MQASPTLNISQEFLMPKALKENLPTFIESVRSFVSNLSNNNPAATKPVPYRKIKSQMAKTPYTDLRNYEIFVPAGMISPYLDYIDSLEAAVKITEGLHDKVLAPFSRWIAVGLSDPDNLKSARGGVTIRDFEPHNIDGTLLELGSHFAKGSNVHKRPFKDAVARNADLEVAMNRANEIHERYLNTDRKKVLKKINDLTTNLDVLIKRIEEEEENYTLSPVTVEMLSKLSFSLAQEIEFYGTVGYQLTTLMTSLHDTSDRLQVLFKKMGR